MKTTTKNEKRSVEKNLRTRYGKREKMCGKV